MQFTIRSQNSSLEEFNQYLTEQQIDILKTIDADLDLDIDEHGHLNLKWKDFTGLKIKADQLLQYHKTFFYKNSIYKEPLARAIGLKKGQVKPSVIDATGGMLGDSLLMLGMGIDNLKTYERHPVLALLILDAIKHYDLKIDFHFGSIQEFICRSSVIYFDPMYHEKNTKASPKKSMAIFRELVGADVDAANVAKKLCMENCQRVVIKRSRKASPLIEKPHHTIEGKSTCYDVYLCSN